eukprot:707939_1
MFSPKWKFVFVVALISLSASMVAAPSPESSPSDDTTINSQIKTASSTLKNTIGAPAAAGEVSTATPVSEVGRSGPKNLERESNTTTSTNNNSQELLSSRLKNNWARRDKDKPSNSRKG